MDSFELLNYAFIVALALAWWRFHDAAHLAPPENRGTARHLSMSGVVVTSRPAPEVPAAEGQALNGVLRRIEQAGGYRDVSEFIDEAKSAYELIVEAFAQGKIDRAAHLLGEGVGQDFERFVAAREQRQESESVTFIGFRAAEIIDAACEGGTAWIEVRFLADLVSVTQDAAGQVIAGHPERVSECAELWTFKRRLGWHSQGWRLAATDADE